MRDYGSGATVFDLIYPNLTMGENSVLCPFHSEKTPSMSINVQQRVFHCFGCGAAGSENDFVAQYYGIGRGHVSVFKEALFKSDALEDYENFAISDGAYRSNYTYKELVRLGISERVLDDLKVGSEVVVTPEEGCAPIIATSKDSTRLVFPVIVKDRVLDTRAYTCNKLESPKTKSKSGAMSGLILPYHLWEHNNDITIVCEGEKDMAFARTYGYNAISLGGAGNIPNAMLECFKDRDVCIVYDNDNPGRAGATKLASALYSVTKYVKIADISKYVKEDKEDITDFFTKYKFGNKEFDEMIEQAKLFDSTEQEKFIKASYTEVSLNEASTTYLGKIVRSNVQVMATYEDQYSVPSYATITKTRNGGKEECNRHRQGDTEYWSLQRNNFEDVLVLTDNNLKKYQISDNIKAIIGWNNEEYVSVNTSNPKTIFKACVADCTESVVAKDIKRTEFTCYTEEKLEAGKNYQLIYKVVPHPYKGQQQVLIVLEVKESGDVITSFETTPDVINDLKEFQKYGFRELVERQKFYIKFNIDNRLLEFIDLWYHTPKEFNFGYMKNVRGYLDGIIITESRVGKSTTAQALSKVYGGIGAIASLAGSAATPAGLIGGSVKAGNSSQIRPGLIPRQHNKAIIFEELAKAKYSLMPELTDIRSSGIVRINRSTGDLTLPASVRILFLTNPKTDGDGAIRPIMAYPNGVEIIKPLVPAIEDIARFDFAYILGDVNTDVDPLWTPPEGFTEKQLQSRIRWVWSRKCNQISISPEIQKYIVDKSKIFNDAYGCSIKIFSSETWKKLARLSIAIAGYMVSTDIDFSDIIVKQRHVDIACALLDSIYNNSIFKLKEYVEEERKQLTCTLLDIDYAMELLKRYPSMIEYMENNNNIAKNTLMTISGLDGALFAEAVQSMSKNHFVTMTRDRIYPTPKMLIAVKKAKSSPAYTK